MNIRKKAYAALIVMLAAGITAGVGAGSQAEAKKKVLPKKIKVVGSAAEKSGLSVSVGEKEKIDYSVKPKKAANRKVSFSSSDKSVAKVTSKGTVKGVDAGKATITVRSKAKKSVKVKIPVVVKKEEAVPAVSVYSLRSAAVPAAAPAAEVLAAPMAQEPLPVSFSNKTTAATAIILDRTEIELAAGESDKLVASLIPVTSTQRVVWSINFTGGINVYQNGSIFVTDDTPVGTTAVITATAGGVKAECTVRVISGPCEHDWGAWQITTEATCLAEGVHTSTCSKCGKTREEPIPATGHSWLGKVVKEPNCTEVGEMEYTCQHCKITRLDIINAKGHTWGTAGEVVEEPDCVRMGKIKYACTVEGCTGEKIETIPALGHSWDNGEITKSPTCTNTGTKMYHCTVENCSGEKKETIPATGHTWTYGEITVEPGCTSIGQRVCTCIYCQAKTTVTLSSLGHKWDEGVVTKEPDCVNQGTKTYTCETCKATKEEGIKPNGHNLGPYETIQKPTCTKVGLEAKRCQNKGCKFMADLRNIPVLGHDFGESDDPQKDKGVVTTEPNCINSGIKTYTCQRETEEKDEQGNPILCGAKKYVLLPALGHDWTKDYVTDEPATCTKSGTKSQHCTRCTKKRFESLILPLGHQWDEKNPVVVPATCTEDGTRTYTCTRETEEKDEQGNPIPCGAKSINIIPATGHSFDAAYTVDIPATCMAAGHESRHCTNTYIDKDGKTATCPKTTDDRIIKPKDHTWSSWQQTLAPAHGIPGLEVRKCSTCNLEQSRGKVEKHEYDSTGTCKKCGKSLNLKKSTIADWNYSVDSKEKTVLLKKYTGTSDSVLIPASMDVTVDGKTDSYQVTFSGAYQPRESSGVFASNRKCKIKAVSFEDGVKITNMQYMFFGCESLEAVVQIPSAVTNLKGTFKNCPMLLDVGKLPAGIQELEGTFDGCESLAVAPDIPAGVTAMEATFKNCKSLVVAPVLPSKVTNLNWTFSGCTKLMEPPALPQTVTEMTNTFRECESLVRVPTDIPAGVTKLTTTFYGCNALETVPKLPSTVTVMEYTFKNCKNLIYAEPLPKSVVTEVGVFDGCDKIQM